MDLYIDLITGDYATSATFAERNPQLRFNQADRFGLRVFLAKARAIVSLPEPYTFLKLNARTTSEGAELLKITAFTEVTDEDGTHYDAVLDLRAEAIDTALGVGGSQVKDFVDGLFQVQMTDGEDPPNRETPVKRGAVTIYRDIYRDDDAPTMVDPEYPPAEQVALKTGNNYRIVNGQMQVKNETTGVWCTISIEGIENEERLVITPVV